MSILQQHSTHNFFTFNILDLMQPSQCFKMVIQEHHKVQYSSQLKRKIENKKCIFNSYTESNPSTCCLARYLSLRSFWKTKLSQARTLRLNTTYQKIKQWEIQKRQTNPFINYKSFTNNPRTGVFWRLLASLKSSLSLSQLAVQFFKSLQSSFNFFQLFIFMYVMKQLRS